MSVNEACVSDPGRFGVTGHWCTGDTPLAVLGASLSKGSKANERHNRAVLEKNWTAPYTLKRRNDSREYSTQGTN